MHNYLIHHGIEGQKWGKRNGPPYPLDSSDHSYAEKKAEEKKRSGMTDEEKARLLRLGMYAAVGVVVGYGAYKLYGSGAITSVKATGEMINLSLEKDGLKDRKLFEVSDLNEITGEHSPIDDINAVNPGRIKLANSYKNVELIDGSSMNCMLCTTAYDMRRRNLEVTAGFSNLGFNAHNSSNDNPIGLLDEIYKDYSFEKNFKPIYSSLPVLESNTYSSKKAMLDEIFKDEPPNSRGNFMGFYKSGGGHSIVWEKDSDGNLFFRDGQVGISDYFSKDAKFNVFDRFDLMNPNTGYVRTDNLELKDEISSRYITTKSTEELYKSKAPAIVANVLEKSGAIGASIGGAVGYKYGKEKMEEEEALIEQQRRRQSSANV